MTTRFAGSRSLDERRRRRIAAENDVAADATQKKRRTSASNAVDEPEMPSVDPALHFPIRKIISQRRWKIWGMGFIGAVIGAALLCGGHFSTTHAEMLGPGFVKMFDFGNGRAIRFYNVVQLILAGEFALLIWWVRSRSLRDFAGRYRVWSWAAAVSFLYAFFISTDAHLAWRETFLWATDVDFPHKEVLCWMVPTLSIIAIMSWTLHLDMQNCRSSKIMLGMAVVVWMLLSGIELSGIDISSVSTAGVPAGPVIEAGLLMLGSWLLTMSLLLHTRYVVYESAEPPDQRPSRLSRFLSRRSAKRKRTSTDSGEKAAEEKSSSPKSEKPNRARATETTSRRKLKETRSASINDELDEPVLRKTKPAKSKSNQSKPTEAERPSEKPGKLTRSAPVDENTSKSEDRPYYQPDVPLDGPPTGEMLKGLSKRERRRLKRQWREQSESQHATS